MKDNRIGAACWYKPADVKTKYSVASGEWRGVYLRAWSTDHEEFESGPGPFPVGVVEDEKTGQCHSIYVTRICFNTEPPRI